MFPLLISLRITQKGQRNPYKHPANICRCTRFQVPKNSPHCAPFLRSCCAEASQFQLWWQLQICIGYGPKTSKRKTEGHTSYVYEWISVLTADLLRSGEVYMRLVLAVKSQSHMNLNWTHQFCRGSTFWHGICIRFGASPFFQTSPHDMDSKDQQKMLPLRPHRFSLGPSEKKTTWPWSVRLSPITPLWWLQHEFQWNINTWMSLDCFEAHIQLLFARIYVTNIT